MVCLNILHTLLEQDNPFLKPGTDRMKNLCWNVVGCMHLALLPFTTNYSNSLLSGVKNELLLTERILKYRVSATNTVYSRWSSGMKGIEEPISNVTFGNCFPNNENIY